MTPKQRIHLMAELWPAACKTQGWNKNDSARRYQVFAAVLGRVPRHARTLAAGGHISANAFDNADFDAIKAHLKMLADNVAGAIETDHPEMGRGRRFYERIAEYVHCLGVYVDDPDAYVREIIRDKFNLGYRVTLLSVSDLSNQPRFFTNKQTGQVEERPSQLEQLLFTLAARVDGKNGLRAQAGHTKHDMYIAAGLACPCAGCCKQRSLQVVAAVCEAQGEPAGELVGAVDQPF